MTTTTKLAPVILALAVGCGDDSGGDGSSTSAASAGTTPGTSVGDDGGPGPGDGDPDATTDAPGTTAPSTTAPGDDTMGGTSSDTTGGPPESVCPPGPYADLPFEGGSISATAVPDTDSHLHTGGLAEGAVWLDGALYFSHFGGGPTPPSTILRLEVGAGGAMAFIDPSGSNGLALDLDDNLLAACHDDGSIARYALDGSRTTVVAQYDGARFNSPNDLTLRSDGTLYFTDPSYQAPQPQPQPVTGVYRVDPSGEVELVDGSLGQPNGISLSPDETTLYVGTPGGVQRYDVAADGTVTTPGTGFGNGLSNVDGMAMDCAGNLYVTMHSQGQVAVVAPDGTTLGTIQVAPSLTNAAFGGDDRRTLYLTAGNPDNGDAIYAVDLAIPGYPY